MDGETIKSFLVGLGFGVDDVSLSKFNKAIASATLKVTALYASVRIAASGIAFGISEISKGFEQMGYEYHIIAPAINKALLLRRELLKAYSAAGINISKVVKASVNLNLSLTKTKFAFEAIYKSVASRFFEVLTKQSDLFRQRIYANMPKIQHVLESLIKFIFKALEATTQLGLRLWSILTRVYDFFAKLDQVTDGWSTKILGAIAIWKLLNLEFLATPLGLILTGLLAILTLFDDFKTYQEGGNSFFNWAPFIPVIDAVTSALKSLWSVLKAISDAVGNLLLSFYLLFKHDFSGAFDAWNASGQAIIDTFTRLWTTIKGLGGALAAIGNWAAPLLGLASSPNVGQNIQNAGPGGIPYVNPVGSQISNNSSQNNQHVSQQTNINITGTPSAQETAKTVSGEQGRVNYDLVRNLKGSFLPGGILK